MQILHVSQQFGEPFAVWMTGEATVNLAAPFCYDKHEQGCQLFGFVCF